MGERKLLNRDKVQQRAEEGICDFLSVLVSGDDLMRKSCRVVEFGAYQLIYWNPEFPPQPHSGTIYVSEFLGKTPKYWVGKM